jgi:hypothetical protein
MDKEAWGTKQNQKLTTGAAVKVEKKTQAFW